MTGLPNAIVKTCVCGRVFTKRADESRPRFLERMFCSNKCRLTAQSSANDLTGTTLGRWVVVDRAQGQGADNSALWNARHDCGTMRVVSSTQLATCRSKGCQPKCEACVGRGSNRSRCGLCRRVGHITVLCPRRKQRGGICLLCAGLPHRVSGRRCLLCRLPYAKEQPDGIDYGARGLSNLARSMGES
jgi:hypothetical protein